VERFGRGVISFTGNGRRDISGRMMDSSERRLNAIKHCFGSFDKFIRILSVCSQTVWEFFERKFQSREMRDFANPRVPRDS
jgi:hypothetical protein